MWVSVREKSLLGGNDTGVYLHDHAGGAVAGSKGQAPGN